MREISERLLNRTLKGWFKSKPLFERHRAVSEADIELAEQKIGTGLPKDLRAWLLLVGYGDINEELSFRLDWLNSIEQGALQGAVVFAQDSLGNFYASAAPDERIIFISRSSPEYALLASNFRTFVEELERRDYKLLDWVESLVGVPYRWDA
jgi:hypothetical protein